jgi:hypothetical protein
MYAVSVRLVALLHVVLCVLAGPSLARAQSVGRLPPFVFDLRFSYPSLGQDPVTAGQIGQDPFTLPARGLGGVAGVHVYPFRGTRMALGFGGEGLLVRASAQEESESGQPVGFAVRQQIRGFSGNFSLNFGDRNGWSYLTAGMGPTIFRTYLGETAPTDPAPGKMTLNMGGGARWFMSAHVAITFDLRFYLFRPEDQTAAYPGRQRYRMLMLAGGLGFK